jgi:hypothetical protein
MGSVYILRQDEMAFFRENGYYKDRPPELAKAKKTTGPKRFVMNKQKPAEKPLPTRRKKGGKIAASSNLDATLFVSRFPEDEVYDDYER